MKKFSGILFLLLLLCVPCFAQDYDTLYNNAEPFPTKLFNDKDPFEDEDALKYSWSPYPLFRTSANLYFKDFTIPPGYYILTPRELKGKYYVLFKENGKVSFIIPVVKKEATPMNFYPANIPEVKKNVWQKTATKIRDKFYTISKDSGRVPPPKTVTDVEVETNYIKVTLFYGEDKYTMLFKRSPY